MGNKITWTYEHEYADEQCGQVDKQENGDVHLSGSLAHIVCRGVEGDESRLLLHYDDGGGNGVAYNESLAVCRTLLLFMPNAFSTPII